MADNFGLLRYGVIHLKFFRNINFLQNLWLSLFVPLLELHQNYERRRQLIHCLFFYTEELLYRLLIFFLTKDK